MGDNWKSVGINVEPLVQTQAQNADKKFVASFPSFNPSQIPIKQDNILARVYGPNCATEENHWNGSNRGCSLVASLDRVNESLQSAIDPTRVRELFRDFNRILTEELRPALLALAKMLADAATPYAIIWGSRFAGPSVGARTTLDIDLAVLDVESIPRAELEAACFVFRGRFAHSENWDGPKACPSRCHNLGRGLR